MANFMKIPGNRTRGSSFDEFDSFPREVRDALNYAMVKWSTHSVRDALRKKTPAAVVEWLKLGDEVAQVKFDEQREAQDFLKDLGL